VSRGPGKEKKTVGVRQQMVKGQYVLQSLLFSQSQAQVKEVVVEPNLIQVLQVVVTTIRNQMARMKIDYC
jgi:hypothetical protein